MVVLVVVVLLAVALAWVDSVEREMTLIIPRWAEPQGIQ